MDELNEKMEAVSLRTRSHPGNFWFQKEKMGGMPRAIPEDIRKWGHNLYSHFGCWDPVIDELSATWETKYPVMTAEDLQEHHRESKKKSFFTKTDRRYLWSKLQSICGFDKDVYRVDLYGNVICWNLYRNQRNASPAISPPGAWCIEYIFPYERGGIGIESNLRAMHTGAAFMKGTGIEQTKPLESFQVGISRYQFLYVVQTGQPFCGFSSIESLLRGRPDDYIITTLTENEKEAALLKIFAHDVGELQQIKCQPDSLSEERYAELVVILQKILKKNGELFTYSFDSIEAAVMGNGVTRQEIRCITDQYRDLKLEIKTEDDTEDIDGDEYYCWHCEKPLYEEAFKCQDCDVALYCSGACFNNDWYSHSSFCKRKDATNQ